MKFHSFMEGIDILRKYIDNPQDTQIISAEHDEFYVFADREISKEDHAKLKKLGWYDNKVNQENSWMAYT